MATARAGTRGARTGFGSPALAAATRVAQACSAVSGTGVPALLAQIRAGLPRLVWYWMQLPGAAVACSDRPEGRVIRQQLAYREPGRMQRRRAQGVLFLPDSFSSYLKGRHRQAVRTNVANARRRGLTVSARTIEDWTVDPDDPRAGQVTAAAPLEVWTAFDANGETVGEAVLTVDDETALLHWAVSSVKDARWLLHTEIVSRLCGSCRTLITNTEDVPLMGAGSQHYQRLLGYSIVRLRARRTIRDRVAAPGVRIAAICLGAAALIVGEQLVSSGIPSV